MEANRSIICVGDELSAPDHMDSSPSISVYDALSSSATAWGSRNPNRGESHWPVTNSHAVRSSKDLACKVVCDSDSCHSHSILDSLDSILNNNVFSE